MKNSKFKMKKFSFLAALCLCASVAMIAGRASGQVPNLLTNAPSTTFFNSVGGYLTSSNPNQPVHGQVEVGLGAAYQSGVNVGADLDVRWKPSFTDISTNIGVGAESVTRNAGVAGTIVSEQIGGFLWYVPASTPDIELSAGANGGYSFYESGPAFSAYLQALKMATLNTYLAGRIGVEEDRGRISTAPVVTVYTGFTF